MVTREPPKRKGKEWWKDPTLLWVGGIGAAAGIVVLLRRRRGDSGESVGGQQSAAIPGGPFYSSVGVDLANAVQDATGGLRQRLEQLTTDVQDVNLRLQKSTPTPSQPTVPPQRPPSPRRRKWPGVGQTRTPFGIRQLRGTYNVRGLAARFSPDKSAQGIQSFYNQLIRLNPSLRGRTTLTTGGFDLRVPR